MVRKLPGKIDLGTMLGAVRARLSRHLKSKMIIAQDLGFPRFVYDFGGIVYDSVF